MRFPRSLSAPDHASRAPLSLDAELGGSWFVSPSDGGVEAGMPDTPMSFDRSVIRDSRGSRTDNSITPGLVLAAILAVLFLFGTRVFDTVKDSANISKQQARIEASGETKTP